MFPWSQSHSRNPAHSSRSKKIEFVWLLTILKNAVPKQKMEAKLNTTADKKNCLDGQICDKTKQKAKNAGNM